MRISSGLINTAQKIVIYGAEGIGKTTFASKFPEPLFIDTEGSTKRLDVRRFDAPSSWAMLLEQVDYVKHHPELCSSLVIDTADWAEKLASTKICSEAKVNGIESFGYSKGYTYLAEEFGRLLNKLEELIALGINIVITAHAAMRKFEQPDEMGAYDRWELKLSKKVAAMLKEWADCVLFINFKTFVVKSQNQMEKNKATGGQRRIMYTTHSACWDAKNRYGLPDECDFDYSVISHFIPSKQSNAVETAPANAAPTAAEAEERRAELKAKIDAFVDDDLDGIPKELNDLMRASGISAYEIQQLVAREGHYPADTPIKNYAPDFVAGWLIAYWTDISKIIIDSRKD